MIYLNKLILLILVLLSSQLSWADQTDIRLDELFSYLQITNNIHRSQIIQAKIWEIWSDAGEKILNEMVHTGVQAMDEGEYVKAYKIFDQIIILAPEFAEGWNKRATLYYLTGRYEDSLADIKITLALEPRHFGALSGRGLCYLQLENLSSALDAFNDALQINPWMDNAKSYIEQIRHILNLDSVISV